MNLGWVTFKVKELKRSLEFYNGLLGLPVAGEINAGPKHIVFLGTEGSQIELIEGEGAPENAGEGVSIGILFDNADELVASLREKGLQVVGPISPNPTIRFFFVSDPDGYTVQICDK